MAHQEAPQDIAGGIPARNNGSPLQVTLEIRGELGGAVVATLGLLAQRLEDDGVEIAAKRSRELLGRAAQLPRVVLGAVGVRVIIFALQHCLRWPWRLAFEYRLCDRDRV